jgi:hypothetical protein
MKCFLTENLKIDFVKQYQPFSDSNFIFNADGCFVASGHILKSKNIREELDTTCGSEPWITEESDFLRFDQKGYLRSFILKLPNWNSEHNVEIPNLISGYFSLRLTSSIKSIILAPQKYRYFNMDKKYLLSFSSESFDFGSATRLLINNNFSFILDRHNFLSGWILENPLSVITDNFGGQFDDTDSDNTTYAIFGEYFSIISNNKCNELDDNMEEVVKLLDRSFTKDKIKKIKGRLRTKLLSSAVDKLKDYFL